MVLPAGPGSSGGYGTGGNNGNIGNGNNGTNNNLDNNSDITARRRFRADRLPLIGQHKRGVSYSYDPQMITYIRVLYVVAIIVWIIILLIFDLYDTDIIGWLLLAIPLIVFLVGYASTSQVTTDVEEDVYKYNYLSIGLLIVLPLLTYMNRDYKGDDGKRQRFTSILVLAIIITMLSMIDFWLPRRWLSAVRHFKSTLQTMSLSLLMYALYTFYVHIPAAVLI